jgi:hypothetical protein
MKTITKLIMTAVLLVMALTVSAQQKKNGVTSGKMSAVNSQKEIFYSFSGGTVTRDDMQGSGDGGHYDYEVEEGATINLSCSGTENVLIGVTANNKSTILASGAKSVSCSYKVPSGLKKFRITMYNDGSSHHPRMDIYCTVKKASKQTAPATKEKTEKKKTFKVENTKKYLCPHCHQKDSKIRFNDLYGEVSIRCNDRDDDVYEFAELDMEIFENDRIRTKEESGAILGLEDMSTYVIKPESELIIRTVEENTPKWKILVGTMISNVKKMAEGRSLEIEMSQCVCGQNGTIFVVEETGKESRVWLMAGSVYVKSKKTGKVTTLQPGQRSITGTNGVVQVKSFNIEEGAKKFGIKMSDINNHYSNKTNKATNTNTTSTTKTAPGKYARYDVKCGIVKRVETTAKERTYTTTWFDDYGRLERIENTKKETKSGNNWVNAANYKLVTIIKDDKQYRLDPNRKRVSTYSLSTITNFLDPNLKLIQGYGVQKTNEKATVSNRQCDVFKGKEAKFAGDATVEHYVWQGIPLKSVVKAPDGTTTTTLVSIELPNSVNASMFNVPSDYKK